MEPLLPNPLLISKRLYWLCVLISILAVLVECILSDYSQRSIPRSANFIVLFVVVITFFHTRMGNTRTNQALGWIGFSMCIVYILEMIMLLIVETGPHYLLLLLYNLFLMTVTAGLVGFIADRRIGVAMGLVVLLFGGLHAFLKPSWFFIRYGVVWFFVVSWFIYLVSSYRSRLENIFATNLAAREALESQKDAMRNMTLKNQDALQLLHARHLQLIEQEKVVFHESLLSNLVKESHRPVEGIIEAGAQAKAALQDLSSFLEDQSESLGANEVAELKQVLIEIRAVLGGIRGEAIIGNRRLQELVVHRPEDGMA